MTATEAEVTIPGTGTPKLNKALSQLQGELPQIKKTKTAEVKDPQGNRVLYKYDYADRWLAPPPRALKSPSSWPSTASRSTALRRSTRPNAVR